MSVVQNFTLEGYVSYVPLAVLGPTDSFSKQVTTKARTSIKQVSETLTEFGVNMSGGSSTKAEISGLPITNISVSGR